jgi:hypothetical protein
MAYTSLGFNDGPPVPQFSARTILASQRFLDLNAREQFYLCTQHNHKMFDFDGRMISGSRSSVMMESAPNSVYVPLRQRRPSSPYRLGKVIVNRFTSMLFGSQRWPAIRVEGDADTQDFCEALIEASALPAKMIEARNVGGSVGTVGISWIFRNGKPIVSVHNGKYLHVSEWEDRERFITSAVSEVYQYPKTEWSAEKKAYVKNLYWYRRDWTKTADTGYQPCLVVPGQDPEWVKDDNTTSEHNDGFCHFVWIQNLPTDEEDGMPDYDGLYDTFDSLDLLLSVAVKGTVLNLDPTLVLKVDPEIIAAVQRIKKGSDHSLMVGKDGGASYLELTGSGLTAALPLFKLLRQCCLEVAECVITDPDEVAAGQTSAVSIQKIFEPMIAKCDIIREQYGSALKRLLQQMVLSAKMHLDEKGPVQTDDGEAITDEKTGEAIKTVPYLDLPLKVIMTPITDDATGQPNGETDIELVERKPGKGGTVILAWGPYFAPTPQDQSALITALNMATAGVAIMSKQTASELLCTAFDRDPAHEWKRINDDKKAVDSDNANKMAAGGMFGGDPGGKVGHEDALPPGAKPKAPPFGAPKPPPAKGPPVPGGEK